MIANQNSYISSMICEVKEMATKHISLFLEVMISLFNFDRKIVAESDERISTVISKYVRCSYAPRKCNHVLYVEF